ncbi:MAG TPA: hypothetical protein VGB45_08095 [Abditibacterium sp.]
MLSLFAMRLYTFFLDYQVGTYISQLRAETPQKAMKNWAKNLDTKPMSGFGPRLKSRLLQEIQEEDFVAVQSLQNVWGFCIRPGGRFGMVHFVETALDG